MISRIGSKDPKALMVMGMAFMVLGRWEIRAGYGRLERGRGRCDPRRFLGLSIGLLLWSVWLNGRIRRGKKN